MPRKSADVLRSMTGFGAGSAEGRDLTARAEIRSVSGVYAAAYEGDFEGFGFGLSGGYADANGPNNDVWNVGGFVSKDDVLLRIDPRDYQTNLLRAQAAVSRSRRPCSSTARR